MPARSCPASARSGKCPRPAGGAAPFPESRLPGGWRYAGGASPLAILALGAVLIGAGCAGVARSPADRLMDKGNYDAAIAIYRTEESERPDDARVKRSLGLALLESGHAPQAQAKLEEAQHLDPEDAPTLYFLAQAAEKSGDTGAALQAYTDYLAKSHKNSAVVRARIHDLTLRRATEQILKAIDRENELEAASIPKNSVAVPEFTNALERKDLDPLSPGLSAILITDLSQVHALRIMERERIRILLDELALAAPEPLAARWYPIDTVQGIKERLKVLLRPNSGEAYYEGPVDDQRDRALLESVRAFQQDHGLTADGIPGQKTQGAIAAALAESGVPPPSRSSASENAEQVLDTSTAPRLGRILGARRFVQGTFAPLGESEIQLNAAIVEVAEAKESAAGAPVSGPLEGVLHLEKDLVYEILKALGIEPTPEERKRIDPLATESYPALLAYGRALNLEDQGRDAEALEEYREALRDDPRFALARDAEERLSVTDEDGRLLDRAEFLDAVMPPPDALDRIVRTGSWVGIGPGPSIDRDGPFDPSVQPADKVGGEIIVEGDLPSTGGKR
jgi:tetratricopeptide (TPR) repeat protein